MKKIFLYFIAFCFAAAAIQMANPAKAKNAWGQRSMPIPIQKRELERVKCPACPQCPEVETPTCPEAGITTPVFLGGELLVDSICFTLVGIHRHRDVIAIKFVLRNSDVFGVRIGDPIPNGIDICNQVEKMYADGTTVNKRYRVCKQSYSDGLGLMEHNWIGIAPGLTPFTMTLDSENAIDELREDNNIIRCTSLNQIEVTSASGEGPCLGLASRDPTYRVDITNGYEGPCPLLQETVE